MTTASDNPFRVSRLEALPYRQPDFSWDAFLQRIEENNWRGAICGAHGNGKTTLFLELRQRLEARGWGVGHIRLSLEERREAPAQLWQLWRETPRDNLLLIDGAEQVSPWTWRRFIRRSRTHRGLLVTRHEPGLLPVLHTCRTTPETMLTLLRSLCPELPPALEARALHCLEQRNGNVRDVLFDLYDHVR